MLWNRGLPVAKMHAHFPHPKDENTYLTIFDRYIMSWSFTHVKHVQTCLIRFVLEMESLWDNDLIDVPVSVILCSPGADHQHATSLPRLCIVPSSNHEEGNLIIERISIIQSAWELLQSEFDTGILPPSGLFKTDSAEEIVEWLIEAFGPLHFPIRRRKKDSPVTLLLARALGTRRFCLKLAGEEKEIIAVRGTNDTSLVFKIHPALHIFENETEIQLEAVKGLPTMPTERSKIDIDLSIIERTWASMVSIMNKEHNTRVGANFRFTLVAELLELYAAVLPVQLVERSDALATYRIEHEQKHPAWGDISYLNALDFVDLAFDENQGEVALNDISDPFTWKKRDLCALTIQQNQDPHTLQVRRADEKAEWPKHAFLKMTNHGNRSLAERKHLLVERSLQMADIRAKFSTRKLWHELHTTHTRDMEFGKTWRLNSSGPFQLIQGPPGTGKTWTCTRLVEDILEKNPAAKILICSKEHLALEHLTESVQSALQNNEGRMVVRISSSSNHRGDSNAQDIPWHRDAERYWDDILTKAGSNKHVKRMLQDEFGNLKPWLYGAYLDEASVICTTTTDLYLLENLRKAEPRIFDYCIVEEAGKAYISELIGGLALSRHWILVGDHMQLPPYQIQRTRRHFHSCLDFAVRDGGQNKLEPGLGKGAEIIVKMIQKYLWGTVPDKDPNAYINEHMDRNFEPFKSIYIDHETIKSTHFLPEQRRMFELLSNMIADIFYETTFEWKKENEHPPETLPSFFQTHGRLVLINTPHASMSKVWKESLDDKRSRNNLKEASTVHAVLKSIGKHHNVVVLTPYNGQVDCIKKCIEEEFPEVEVYTTDGYQGKEADFIVLSLVRNNLMTGRRRWGFVSDPHRLNVALSRAREGLTIITSAQQIEETEFEDGRAHLQRVLTYIQKHGSIIEPEVVE